jgi:antitoxin MazE
MEVMIKKWGNSAAVRLPAAVMKAANIALDQPVEVHAEDGRVVIQPARKHDYRLDDLLAGITRKNRHEAVDTGPAVGREVL